MAWKAGGDGKPISFNGANWSWKDRTGYCPALGEPCMCSEGGLAKAFCRNIAANSAKESS